MHMFCIYVIYYNSLCLCISILSGAVVMKFNSPPELVLYYNHMESKFEVKNGRSNHLSFYF